MATTGDDRTNDQMNTTGDTNVQNGGQDTVGVTGPPATVTSDANSLPTGNQTGQANNQAQPNYNNYGYNMGYNNMGHMQHQNQFQPSAAQPLQIPNYGGYYGQQQQFNPYFQQHSGYMPQHQAPPPPPPQAQMPAFAPPPPPPPPQAAAMQAASDPSVYDDSIRDNATDQGDEEEFSGQVSDKLDEWMTQMQEKPSVGPKICKKLARYMTYQLEQGFNTADLDYSIKEYPPLQNLPLAWAPELESDIFAHTRFQNNKPLVATEVA